MTHRSKQHAPSPSVSSSKAKTPSSTPSSPFMQKEQRAGSEPLAKTHDGDPVFRTDYDPHHPHEPFVNAHGVVIGDGHYDSEHSPLNHWSDAIDPLIMAGETWVHPTHDVGWKSSENQALLAEGAIPGEGPFSHPMEDVESDVDAHALTPAEHHALNQLISRASAKNQKK